MPDYSEQTNDQLREILDDYGLPKSGNKDELIARIEKYEATGQVDSDEEPEEESGQVAGDSANEENFEATDEAPDTDLAANQPNESNDPSSAGAVHSGDPEPAADQVLLRMTRANASFSTSGVTFTSKDPFQPVSKEKADHILKTFSGFRVAHPHEAEDYYART